MYRRVREKEIEKTNNNNREREAMEGGIHKEKDDHLGGLDSATHWLRSEQMPPAEHRVHAGILLSLCFGSDIP